MANTIKARFVGGPYHNRVMECTCLNSIKVVQNRTPVSVLSKCDTFTPSNIDCTEYLLFRFVSEGGAVFAQYVHESMMRGREPISESFMPPPLPDQYYNQFMDGLLKAGRRFR